MSAIAQPRAAARVPLVGHGRADSIAAYRRGVPVTAARLLQDAATVAAAMPAAGHVLNGCGDRYAFAVTLCAAILRGQVTMMPASTSPHVVAQLRERAPDLYFVADDEADDAVDLPRLALPALGAGDASFAGVPDVPADQAVACLFTSGTTGAPQPHFKAWGSLVRNVRGEARRLQVGPGHTILGTVPPQHMYGFESTVLLPLVTGAALTAERPFFPADIHAAIARLPAPRMLFTTPFHLRMWMESGEVGSLETIVSATAPLSVALARTAEERTGAAVHEIYGCTEAGQIATRRPVEGPEWLAFDGLQLSREGGNTVVAGGHVEEPTPLQDVIDLLDDGRRFLLHGRHADMVNIAGKRNSLAYLNHQLTAIEGVVDGVFFLPEEAEPGAITRLVAFAVAPTLTAAAILAQLRERIDAAFLPRPLYLVEALPRQATGKLPREALVALAREARQRAGH